MCGMTDPLALQRPARVNLNGLLSLLGGQASSLIGLVSLVEEAALAADPACVWQGGRYTAVAYRADHSRAGSGYKAEKRWWGRQSTMSFLLCTRFTGKESAHDDQSLPPPN